MVEQLSFDEKVMEVDLEGILEVFQRFLNVLEGFLKVEWSTWERSLGCWTRK
jgi:hypothetical protein